MNKSTSIIKVNDIAVNIGITVDPKGNNCTINIEGDKDLLLGLTEYDTEQLVDALTKVLPQKARHEEAHYFVLQLAEFARNDDMDERQKAFSRLKALSFAYADKYGRGRYG